MPIKNKHTKALQLDFDFSRVSDGLGFAALSAAAVLSLVELESLRQERIAVMQPAYAAVGTTPAERVGGEELIRRGEKEESPHSLVSYGTTMRSHATAGRR